MTVQLSPMFGETDYPFWLFYLDSFYFSYSYSSWFLHAFSWKSRIRAGKPSIFSTSFSLFSQDCSMIWVLCFTTATLSHSLVCLMSIYHHCHMKSTPRKTRNCQGNGSGALKVPTDIVNRWEKVRDEDQNPGRANSWGLLFSGHKVPPVKMPLEIWNVDTTLNYLYCITLKMTLKISLEWHSGGSRENNILTRLASQCGYRLLVGSWSVLLWGFLLLSVVWVLFYSFYKPYKTIGKPNSLMELESLLLNQNSMALFNLTREANNPWENYCFYCTL